VTMSRLPTPVRPRAPRETGARLLHILLTASLGALAALLISCSSSGKGLIPVSNAGPLQGDFEAVAQAAENGDGKCSQTESTLLKTDQDFAALPTSVDAGLRNTLHQGIENLRSRSLALCAQPLPQSTVTTTVPKTTSTATTTSTETESTETQTPPAPETERPSGPGGGTQAPGETHVGEAEGGTGAGEGAAGAAPGATPGGQEAGK
jgi:hypothetical protein